MPRSKSKGESTSLPEPQQQQPHYVSWYTDTTNRLVRIELKLDLLLKQEATLMATVGDVQNAVTSETTVVGSVVTLLQQLSTMLKAAIASNDPAALQAVVDSINSNAQTLADAVTANTPAS